MLYDKILLIVFSSFLGLVLVSDLFQRNRDALLILVDTIEGEDWIGQILGKLARIQSTSTTSNIVVTTLSQQNYIESTQLASFSRFTDLVITISCCLGFFSYYLRAI